MTRRPIPASQWDFSADSWPDDDCVAAGADLEPATLIDAYRHGVFPMHQDTTLLWWSPMLRGVLRPGDLKISRSLGRSIKRFTTRVDTRFNDVVAACADPKRQGAWINADIHDAYSRLHELGWAHSVEVFDGDDLVGGLYGVAIGGVFAGESMFHVARDASKVALVELVRRWGDGLIDTQWSTPHLASLGVSEMRRIDYLSALSELIAEPERQVWSCTTSS